ncbi:MAG: branched-chain amino acid ABC transporter permease [Syntrophaceae bacterium]
MKRLFILVVLMLTPLVLCRGELSYYLSLMTMTGISAVVALSLNLLLGYTGQISLCHAAFFGLGAYAAAIGSVNFGLNPWLGLGLSCLLPAGVALLVGLPTVRLKEHYLAMATLGIGVIVYAILRANPFGATGGPGGIFAIPSLEIMGVTIDNDISRHVLVTAALIVVYVLCESLISSRFGALMQAVHTSPRAVSSLGIDLEAAKLKIFVLSACLAGLAGGLYCFCSPLAYINPDDVASVMLSVKFIVMVVIGGSMSLLGGVIGALAVTWLPELLRAASAWVPLANPTDFEAVIYGVVLIATLIYAPQGLIRPGGARAQG